MSTTLIDVKFDSTIEWYALSWINEEMTMGATLIGLVFGALAGAITGTEFGLWAGAFTGMCIGFSIYAVEWLVDHFGDAPVVERHHIMCERYGQAVDVTFVGDLHTKRWHDVESCTLQKGEIKCHKGCVSLMKSAHVRPGRACGCHS